MSLTLRSLDGGNGVTLSVANNDVITVAAGDTGMSTITYTGTIAGSAVIDATNSSTAAGSTAIKGTSALYGIWGVTTSNSGYGGAFTGPEFALQAGVADAGRNTGTGADLSLTGDGTIFMRHTAVVPSSPTSGFCKLYFEGDVLKYITNSGVVKTVTAV